MAYKIKVERKRDLHIPSFVTAHVRCVCDCFRFNDFNRCDIVWEINIQKQERNSEKQKYLQYERIVVKLYQTNTWLRLLIYSICVCVCVFFLLIEFDSFSLR